MNQNMSIRKTDIHGNLEHKFEQFYIQSSALDSGRTSIIFWEGVELQRETRKTHIEQENDKKVRLALNNVLLQHFFCCWNCQMWSNFNAFEIISWEEGTNWHDWGKQYIFHWRGDWGQCPQWAPPAVDSSRGEIISGLLDIYKNVFVNLGQCLIISCVMKRFLRQIYISKITSSLTVDWKLKDDLRVYERFFIRLLGSAIFTATLNLVTRVRSPLFLKHWKMEVFWFIF